MPFTNLRCDLRPRRQLIIGKGERMKIKIAFKSFAIFALVSIVLSAVVLPPLPPRWLHTGARVHSGACSNSGCAGCDRSTDCRKGEGEVDIVDWPGYVERGANDPKYDWVTGFEKQTGCMVKVKDAATSDEMVQLINSGGFDLVTASGDASLRLVYGKSVQEIDISRIPSYKNVDPRLQNAPWHTVDGKHYGVSYQWGPNVLMYNTKVFPTAPTSWNVVFTANDLAGWQIKQRSCSGICRPDLHCRCRQLFEVP